jgi:hypothetical protein
VSVVPKITGFPAPWTLASRKFLEQIFLLRVFKNFLFILMDEKRRRGETRQRERKETNQPV